MLSPKHPADMTAWKVTAVNKTPLGRIVGARLRCAHISVTTTIADGAYHVSAVALEGFDLTDDDMAAIREQFDMVDAIEDPWTATVFHRPPRMLRLPAEVEAPFSHEVERRSKQTVASKPVDARASLARLLPRTLRDS